MIMRVLVACEFTQIVTKAFRNKGHEAYSCDLLPTEGNPDWHIQGDVLEILGNGWDLMIAHPPCTYLSSVGLHWNNKIDGRKQKTEDAFDFFMKLHNAHIEKVCIENPVGYIGSHFRKADQIINPFQFGHPERKRTCLWLRNLPQLKSTKIVEPEKPVYICKSGRPLYFIDAMSPGPDRQKDRSRTFPGIAKAMAEQWG